MRPGDAGRNFGDYCQFTDREKGGVSSEGRGRKGDGWVKLTGNQVRATGALADALFHDEVKPILEVLPGRFAARVDSQRILVAHECDSKVICVPPTG